jgi:hypothetical protein
MFTSAFLFSISTAFVYRRNRIIEMKNCLILLFLSFTGCVIPSSAQGLHAEGTKIVNAKGENVILRGMRMNGNAAARGINVPATGGLNTFQQLEIKNIKLDKGKQVLRVYAGTGGFNFSSIQFQKHSN